MAQFGSISATRVKVFTVSGWKKECCWLTPRSNCAWAAAEHSTEESTTPYSA